MKPTKKQMDFIKVMESYLYPYYYEEEDILFKGTTKEEASKWISDNVPQIVRIAIPKSSPAVATIETILGLGTEAAAAKKSATESEG